MEKHKKVVYLFGAGATHAEVMNMHKELTAKIIKEKGLLIEHVSRRVIAKARKDKNFIKDIECIISSNRPSNIEELISLIETNRIKKASKKTDKLRKLVEKDILSHLRGDKESNEPVLYKSLLELHNRIDDKEKVLGLITLNYDNLLDKAYTKILRKEPNYCTKFGSSNDWPLLKLHGSFEWPKIRMGKNEISVGIMPLGIRKDYLELPFNFIWGRAGEILAECDTLRVIGCSLAQNDWGLIDLLFKSHLWKGEPYEIEIIDFDTAGEYIRNHFGFLPRITKAYGIESGIIAGDINSPDVHPLANPFKIWLDAKARRMLNQGEIASTTYLKQVCAEGIL